MTKKAIAHLASKEFKNELKAVEKHVAKKEQLTDKTEDTPAGETKPSMCSEFSKVAPWIVLMLNFFKIFKPKHPAIKAVNNFLNSMQAICALENPGL